MQPCWLAAAVSSVASAVFPWPEPLGGGTDVLYVTPPEQVSVSEEIDWVNDPLSGSGLIMFTSGKSACIMKNVVKEPTAVISVLLAPAGAAAIAAVAPQPASTMAPARRPRLNIDRLSFTFAPS
jgi:hypothetical protein